MNNATMMSSMKDSKVETLSCILVYLQYIISVYNFVIRLRKHIHKCSQPRRFDQIAIIDQYTGYTVSHPGNHLIDYAISVDSNIPEHILGYSRFRSAATQVHEY